MAMEAAPVTTRQVDVAAIHVLLDRIVARWNPQQVWLFGSRARGDSTPESDWDLFVVVDDSAADDELDPGVGRRLRRSCGVRADVIPWHASEFAEFRTTPNTLGIRLPKTACCFMSAEVLIASYLRIASEDLAGARQLSATGNRNAM